MLPIFDNIEIPAENTILQVKETDYLVRTYHPVFRGVSEKKGSNKGSEQNKHFP